MNETEINIKIRKAIKIINSLNSKINETDIIVKKVSKENEELSRNNFSLINIVSEKKEELISYNKRDKDIVHKVRTKLKRLSKILDNK